MRGWGTLFDLKVLHVTDKRDRLEIIADVLEAAEEPAKKTHLVYDANLNTKVLNEILPNLLNTGLMDHDEDENLYETTERGEEFLDLHDKLRDLLE